MGKLRQEGGHCGGGGHPMPASSSSPRPPPPPHPGVPGWGLSGAAAPPQGAFGRCYRLSEVGSGRGYAAKVIPRARLKDPGVAERVSTGGGGSPEETPALPLLFPFSPFFPPLPLFSPFLPLISPSPPFLLLPPFPSFSPLFPPFPLYFPLLPPFSPLFPLFPPYFPFFPLPPLPFFPLFPLLSPFSPFFSLLPLYFPLFLLPPLPFFPFFSLLSLSPFFLPSSPFFPFFPLLPPLFPPSPPFFPLFPSFFPFSPLLPLYFPLFLLPPLPFFPFFSLLSLFSPFFPLFPLLSPSPPFISPFFPLPPSPPFSPLLPIPASPMAGSLGVFSPCPPPAEGFPRGAGGSLPPPQVQREQELQGRLRHRHVLRLHGHLATRSHLYLLLELCGRRSLADILRARGVLTEPEARYYLRQGGEGLSYLHGQGLVHRDLKPSNVLVTERMQVKIGDLGLARPAAVGTRCWGALCGTPAYMAPEVLDRKGHGAPSDIWALGCIMYEVLTGSPPFEAAERQELYGNIRTARYPLPPSLSPRARALLGRLLLPDPTARAGLGELLEHGFFTQGFTPDSLPPHACRTVPVFCLLKGAVVALARRWVNWEHWDAATRPPPKEQVPGQELSPAAMG
ncbi:uncharacterized protein [Anas acuta]|uniref:uncharacterized protein isoform X2 n=1 Tax=Anas acuta TaxID=28680 RepID=UPI0035C8C332